MNKTNYDDINSTNDHELIMLYLEDDEAAKDILYYKYKFIIDVLIKKYKKILSNSNVDMQELYSEASVAFSDALKNYNPRKDASVPTFITLCVERRLNNLLKKYRTDKYKCLHDTYSLDFFYDDNKSLMDVISNSLYDPLEIMYEKEDYNELIKNIKNSLTDFEYEVYLLILGDMNYQEIAKILGKNNKQIDNCIQRIKTKIKKIVLDKK